MNKIQLDAVLRLVDVKINPRVFQQISRSVAGMPAGLQATTKGIAAANTQATGLNRTLKQTATQLSTSERAARLFLQRMAQFAVLLPAFATLNRSLQGGVKFLFEFDKELRNIVRINIEGLIDRLDEIGDRALTIGKNFGQSATEVAASIRLFAQAGFEIEQAFRLTEAATLATKTSTLDLANSQELLVAIIKQFDVEAQGAEAALDKFVRVEDLAAAGAQDLAEALRTGGNALAFASKSLDDTIGLIAALREQSRKSGREIGTFFKTLSTRLLAAGEARNAVEALGVQVENADGSLRPLLAILNDLKTAFDGLTEAQAANAAKAIGGIRQFESLLATLNSLERANELSAGASDSLGTQQEKLAVVSQSLDFQLQQLIASGQELAKSLGDAGLVDTLSDALKLVNLLFSAFTRTLEAVKDIGVNITPLLAIGGLTLGRSIFGGRGGPGGGAAQGGPSPQIAAATSQFPKFTDALRKATLNSGRSFDVLNRELVMSARILGLNSRALNTNTAAISTTTRRSRLLANAFAQTTKAVKTAGAAVAKPLENAGVRIVALTAAATTAAAVLDGTAGQVAQAGLQFAFFGAKAGLAAAGLEAFRQILKTLETERQGEREIRALERRESSIAAVAGQVAIDEQSTSRLAFALSEAFQNAQGRQGEIAFQTIGRRFLEGEALATRGASVQALRDVNPFEVITRPGVIQSLSNLNNTFFSNIEAVNELRASFDDAGDSTLSTGQQLKLLRAAFGEVQEEINETTGTLQRSLIATFAEFKKREEIIGLGKSIFDLNETIDRARLAPEKLADGIDILRQELEKAELDSVFDLDAINRQRDALVRLSEGINPSRARELSAEIRNLLGKGLDAAVDGGAATAGEKFQELIFNLLPEEAAFAQQVAKLEVEARKIEENRFAARQKLEEELNSRTKKLLEDEKQAAEEAALATDKFKIALEQIGVGFGAADLDQLINLSQEDLRNIISGDLDIGGALGDVIKSAFGDEVLKAQGELSAAQLETELTTRQLAAQLSELDDEIEKLGKTEAGTEDDLKKRQLQIERNAAASQLEQAAREGALKQAEATLGLLQAEQREADKAAEAERRRLQALEDLNAATNDFENQLRDAKMAFEDFEAARLQELFQEEANAQAELKQTQQEVLSSTEQLDEAYKNLNRAILDFNGAVAEAQIKSNLLSRDIGVLTGAISTFQGRLGSLESSFNSVLQDANITLEQRIALERQLAEETLSFLEQAQNEIVSAGLSIFGQTGAENRQLQEGIAGLNFVAQQLGGTFENFLGLSATDLQNVGQQLLSLPVDFRQSILDALSFLPSTVSIGGFSVDQLETVLGQVGAGVAPDEGLPSIEELTNEQVEQLKTLQGLASQDAQLQISQVIAAQEQLDVSREQLEAAKILEARAIENLQEVRAGVAEQVSILNEANILNSELTDKVIAAGDATALRQIEKEAQLFADQNNVFRDVGKFIVDGISSTIGSRLSLIEATAAVGSAAAGYVPNMAGGNLTPSEAAALLRAGAREKKAMPGGAGLAVANTSEAIIPMRNRGFIPNFQEGNLDIAAGIQAIKGINETVVAAIARSVTQTLTDLQRSDNNIPELDEVTAVLSDIRGVLNDISESNTVIQTNTSSDAGETTTTPTAGSTERVNITLQTNQNNTVTVTGLESLREQLRDAVRENTLAQVDEQIEPLLAELDAIFQVLRERGLLTSFGQPG
jgi:TP901 family phage tail tape measure protein